MAKVIKMLFEAQTGDFIDGKWKPKIELWTAYINPESVSRISPIKTKEGANRTILHMKRGPYLIASMVIEEVVARLFPHTRDDEPEAYYSEE